ncbi:unnamed protein product [Prorocentrum cordatum]|uniref:peptidyl-tRNA hydrolase n=1 Tax=Prorocentrum cordatum TaxID=2364126 RepID=A0ABN9SU12_9DINO|nr:unnamed protein product [Polarella glacialis]
MGSAAAAAVTPNDAAALSSLAALPFLGAAVRRGGGSAQWACSLALASAASLLYHAAETTRHDCGSHDLPGAGWARAWAGYEEQLLPVDRACAAVAFAATAWACGGPAEALRRLSSSAGSLAQAVLGVCCLLASDFCGLTRWTYALVHSVWHLCAFALAGRLVLLGGPAPPFADPVDLLVVGLGNPGPEYERTRHNLGAQVIRLLAARLGAELAPARGACALVATVVLGGCKVALACPRTYMNRSGVAVEALCRAHGVARAEQVVVVHDELDLPPGRLKLKLGGSEAGHNGLRSVAARLGSLDFVRVRVGVGKPPKGRGPEWVLSRAQDPEAAAALDAAAERAADAIEALAEGGLEKAMTTFNGRA